MRYEGMLFNVIRCDVMYDVLCIILCDATGWDMTVCCLLRQDVMTAPWRPFAQPRSSGILYRQIPGNLPYVIMYSTVQRSDHTH